MCEETGEILEHCFGIFDPILQIFWLILLSKLPGEGRKKAAEIQTVLEDCKMGLKIPKLCSNGTVNI